jgi:hypothetical protein
MGRRKRDVGRGAPAPAMTKPVAGSPCSVTESPVIDASPRGTRTRRPQSLPDDLDLEPPFAGAVQLGQDDALVLAEEDLAVGHRQRDRPPQ